MLIYSMCFFRALPQAREVAIEFRQNIHCYLHKIQFFANNVELQLKLQQGQLSVSNIQKYFPSETWTGIQRCQGHTDYESKTILIRCTLKNHNVKVTNARIPPEETWQVWYLQSWIWLGQQVSQCSLDLFPRQSCAV